MLYSEAGGAGSAQSATTASRAISFAALASTTWPSSEQHMEPATTPPPPGPLPWLASGWAVQRKPSTRLSSSCLRHRVSRPGRLCTYIRVVGKGRLAVGSRCSGRMVRAKHTLCCPSMRKAQGVSSPGGPGVPCHLTTHTSWAAPTCNASEASTLTTPGPCTDMKGEAKHSGASNDALRSVLRSPSRMLATGQGQQVSGVTGLKRWQQLAYPRCSTRTAARTSSQSGSQGMLHSTPVGYSRR